MAPTQSITPSILEETITQTTTEGQKTHDWTLQDCHGHQKHSKSETVTAKGGCEEATRNKCHVVSQTGALGQKDIR